MNTFQQTTGIQANRLASRDEISHEEWLRLRKLGIGGSEIAAVAGVSPWKPAIAVYYDKTTDEIDDQPTERMQWGNILEDVIAKEYARRAGVRIQRVNAVLQHPEHTWALANIDRLIWNSEHGNGVLEIKNMGYWSAKKVREALYDAEKPEDAIPPHYMLQLQWYMFVTGLRWGMFAALLEGSELFVAPVERDDELIDMLVTMGAEFWQMVEDRTPPAPDGTDGSSEILKALYPESEPEKAIDLNGEAELLCQRRAVLKAQESEMGTELKEIDNKLKAMLQDAEIGRVENYKISWKTNRKGTRQFRVSEVSSN